MSATVDAAPWGPVTTPRVGQKLWGWVLDYWYVTHWTVRAVLGKGTSDHLLRPPTEPRSPILLIPGVYESWRFMQPLADHLHRAGHPVHVLDQLGYNTGAIPAMADIVSEYVRRLDLKDVTVVAHSKGGLIAKCALADPDTLRRVGRLIALNTPFSGSRYAYLFLLRSVRMFTPTGAVITELRERLSVNHRISSLYSAFDPHIPETSRLEGAENIILPTIGHFRPIGDPTTFRAIDAILARSRHTSR
ncbi:MAG: esterase/lipase family protein [Actinomycetes bacterium]